MSYSLSFDTQAILRLLQTPSLRRYIVDSTAIYRLPTKGVLSLYIPRETALGIQYTGSALSSIIGINGIIQVYDAYNRPITPPLYGRASGYLVQELRITFKDQRIPQNFTRVYSQSPEEFVQGVDAGLQFLGLSPDIVSSHLISAAQ